MSAQCFQISVENPILYHVQSNDSFNIESGVRLDQIDGAISDILKSFLELKKQQDNLLRQQEKIKAGHFWTESEKTRENDLYVKAHSALKQAQDVHQHRLAQYRVTEIRRSEYLPFGSGYTPPSTLLA